MLTVAIPTYNRNSILRENIQRLLPQLDEECQLLILDNCSDHPVSDSISDVLAHFSGLRWEIVRNRVNIGANANLLRCFELCQTEWIWLLGDDDPVTPDAVEIILKHIKENPDALYLNFYSGVVPFTRTTAFTTSGLEQFAMRMDSFGNVQYISTGIFRAVSLLPYIKVAYHYAYSTAPHVVLLMMSLGDAGLCYFSTAQIVDFVGGTPDVEQQPLGFTIALGVPTLLELPMQSRARKLLAQRILDLGDVVFSRRTIFRQLLFLELNSKETSTSVYIYEQFLSRLYCFDTNILHRIEVWVYSILLRFPEISFKFLFVPYKVLRGRTEKSIMNPDRFRRM